MTDFKTKYGPWALVAGASEGLGAAFAVELAKRGLNLVLIARRLDKLESLSDELRNSYQVEIKCFSVDLTDFSKIKSCVSDLGLPIGLLVYNAAYAPIGWFEDVAEEDLKKVVEVNMATPLLLSKLLSAKMIEQGRGGVVLMSSLAGTQGSPKIAAYAASKAFNAILSEGLWYELKKHGVDVVASCAGAITTPGYKNTQQAKDPPGTLDASRVAAETLNALGKGPKVIPGFTNKLVYFFMRRLVPGKMAISIMGHNTKNIS